MAAALCEGFISELRSNSESELEWTADRLFAEIMEPEAEQSDALGKRMKRRQQCLPGGNECRQVGDRRRKALRARDQGEVAIFDLERHRSAGDLGPLDTR